MRNDARIEQVHDQPTGFAGRRGRPPRGGMGYHSFIPQCGPSLPRPIRPASGASIEVTRARV